MILSTQDKINWQLSRLPQPTNIIPNDFQSRIITQPQANKILKACEGSYWDFIELRSELVETIVDFNRLTCLQQKAGAYRTDNVEIGVDYHGIIILTIGGLDEDALFLRLDSDTNIVIQEVAL